MSDAPTASSEGLNFDLPDEIRMLKDTVRKFVDKELIPIERTARDGHRLRSTLRGSALSPSATVRMAEISVSSSL